MKAPSLKKGKTDEPAKPGGKLKSARITLLIAGLVAVLSLGGGIYFARYALQKDSAAFEAGATPQEAPSAAEGEHGTTAKEEDRGAGKSGDTPEDKGAATGLLEIGDLTTNITGFDAKGAPTRGFLKLNVVIAYKPDPDSKALMESRKPFTKDLFNAYIRGLSEADLRGTIGILTLKSELLKRARAAVGSDVPQEVLINDLIVN